MHFDASNMRRHIATQCTEAHLEKVDGIVVVDMATVGPARRAKPGPKQVDLQRYLRGRVTAFTTQGDDERIEYMFTSGMIDAFLTKHIEDIPCYLFENLWGSAAPEQFQSLVMFHNAIREIIEYDMDSGEITCANRGALTKKFIKEFACYALEFAYAVAKDSVPSRLPSKLPEGRDMFERLCFQIDGMTLRDAVKSSGSYTKKSFAMRHKLDAMLGKLEDSMRTHFPSCFLH